MSLTQEKKSSRGRDIFIETVASTIGGIMNIVVGHPFDTIKTRMQILHTSFSNCLKEMIKTEGPLSLFKGITSPLMTVPFQRTLTFLSVEFVVKQLGTDFKNMNTIQAVQGGMFAGLVTGTVNSPFELIKCKLQMEGVGERGKKTGTIELGTKIYKESGLKGLYRGYTVTVLRNSMISGTMYGTFSYTKQILNQLFGTKRYNSFIAGAFSGAMMWSLAFPVDLVKSRYQTSSKGYKEIVNEVYREKGIKGFYKGVGASVTRAPIAVSILFFVYEEIKDSLSKII